jgi:dTDP-4-dehydrorhamnose reductase
MRILILGGDGMLGHQLLTSLSAKHEAKVTLHQPLAAYKAYGMFDNTNSYGGIDVVNLESLIEVCAHFQPEIMINAIGIVKQRPSAKDAITCLQVNALLPHRLAQLCKLINARFIQISTDCVFSGKKGHYQEDDFPDAEDLYGRTKLLGEVVEGHCITLRSSIIGLELARKTSLIEWFLAQTGEIKGYTKAIYTGLTTQAMSKLIDDLISHFPKLSGLWHVASAPINKYNLLSLLSEKMGRKDIKIKPDDTFICDRSLSGERFTKITGYRAPSWDEMLNELAQQISMR